MSFLGRSRPYCSLVGSENPFLTLVACVVFSEVEEVSEGNGHKGEVTGGNLSVIGTSTDIEDVRRDTGATIGEMENGTQEEIEDMTS